MKRLIVMRHAKSAWDTDAATDHERPLASRGRKDAPRVGAELARLDWVPERVISSDSQRTRETWSRVSGSLPGGVEVSFTRALYHGGVGAVQAALQGLPDAVTTAMVLGHNPGFEHVVAFLTGEGVRMTTANAALLVHDADRWRLAVTSPGGWEIEDLIRPKEL